MTEQPRSTRAVYCYTVILYAVGDSADDARVRVIDCVESAMMTARGDIEAYRVKPNWRKALPGELERLEQESSEP